ncbi:MAG: hypothetical protein E4H14_06140 [Candidatus Thorarchaeota archaeon]|nr:MAG: hypothetical protein E4H14_06140 [Candidatus Thorarchaeota archaeon]
MLQFNPEIYWSIWHLVGMVLSVPLIVYWLSSRIEWVKQVKIENKVIPMKIIRAYMVPISFPFIIAGFTDTIANIAAYPNLFEQIMRKELIYYMGVLGGFVGVYLIFIMSNRLMVDPWDKPEDTNALPN